MSCTCLLSLRWISRQACVFYIYIWDLFPFYEMLQHHYFPSDYVCKSTFIVFKNLTGAAFAKNLISEIWETTLLTGRQSERWQSGFISICIYLLFEARRASYKAGISQKLYEILFSFCFSHLRTTVHLGEQGSRKKYCKKTLLSCFAGSNMRTTEDRKSPNFSCLSHTLNRQGMARIVRWLSVI